MFPSAIYFDTNCLRDAGEFLDCRTMPKLLGQARGFGIHLHIAQLVLDERLQNLKDGLLRKMDRIRQDLKSVERSVGKEVMTHANDSNDELVELMSQAYVARIKNAGLTVIANVDVALRDLISRAVTKRPPFEKGERASGTRSFSNRSWLMPANLTKTDTFLF